MRRSTSHARDERTWVLGLTFAMAAGVLPGFAQTKDAPATLTLKDALTLAEKNDPALLAASSDRGGQRRSQTGARGSVSLALRPVGIPRHAGQRKATTGQIRHQ